MCYNVYGDFMLGVIISALDRCEAMQFYIDDRVQTLYDNGGELYYDNDLVTLLKTDPNIAALSKEDFDTLVNVILKAVNDKTEARRVIEQESENKANDYAYYGYADRSSAYWNLREFELNSYNKTLYDCYREYVEERKVK